MAESEQITYHVTTSQTWFQNRSQIFVSGTRCAFSEERKSSESGFFSLSKRALLVPETKNCSEIRTVTWSVIWLWKLKFSIFVCLFTFLFVPHILPISQKENGPIMTSKTVLKSGLWRCSESGCGIFNLKFLYFSLHSTHQLQRHIHREFVNVSSAKSLRVWSLSLRIWRIAIFQFFCARYFLSYYKILMRRHLASKYSQICLCL